MCNLTLIMERSSGLLTLKKFESQSHYNGFGCRMKVESNYCEHDSSIGNLHWVRVSLSPEKIFQLAPNFIFLSHRNSNRDHTLQTSTSGGHMTSWDHMSTQPGFTPNMSHFSFSTQAPNEPQGVLEWFRGVPGLLGRLPALFRLNSGFLELVPEILWN